MILVVSTPKGPKLMLSVKSNFHQTQGMPNICSKSGLTLHCYNLMTYLTVAFGDIAANVRALQ